MALDLFKTAPQVEDMAGIMKTRQVEHETRLQSALAQLAVAEPNALQSRRDNARFTWLAAHIQEDLSRHYSPSTPPEDHIVAAVDGSQIDVDRHWLAQCFLINIGKVLLRYGRQANAHLENHPTLYVEDKDTVIEDPRGTRNQRIEGSLLGIRRTVDEIKALAEVVSQTSFDIPVLALLDGSLILWSLAAQSYPDFVRKALLHDGFLPALDTLHQSSQRRQVAVASYISMPRATDVVNTLRLSVCPFNPINCDHHCGTLRNGERPCDEVDGVLDRELFARVLSPGERSATFFTASSIVTEHYGQHAIAFFYINVGHEVARVEVPNWVAKNQDLLEITHTLVLEQIRRGQGYPVALSEAHEQAVVSNHDRRQFQYLVEQYLLEPSFPNRISEKARSKAMRSV